MSEMPEFEERLAALESVVGPLDRDMGDLKALLRSQTSLLQALHENQNGMQRVLGEHSLVLGEMVLHWTRSSERLTDLDRRVGAVEVGLRDVDRRLAGVDERLAGVDDRLAGVDERLAGVDVRLAGVDDRLAGVDERLAGVDVRLAVLQEGQAALQEGQAEILRRLPGA
jgi:hypothetical protein